MSATFQNLKVTNDTNISFTVTCNGHVTPKPLGPGDSYTFKNVNVNPPNGIQLVILGSDISQPDQITLTSNQEVTKWHQTVSGIPGPTPQPGGTTGETLYVGLRIDHDQPLAGVVIVGTVDTGGYIE